MFVVTIVFTLIFPLMAQAAASLPEIIKKNQKVILEEWLRQQQTMSARVVQGRETEIAEQSREFLGLLTDALQLGASNIESAAWTPVREFLETVSRSRARQGFSPTETATFVFSIKDPVFQSLGSELKDKPALLAEQVMAVSNILDRLGLYTTEVYQRSREEVISRQQQELMELSTPVVKLWDEVLALPLIGTLDSARTQVVMENLLQEIVRTSASIAIIDITGVPTVDTLVAQHLLKTVAAARLMGADCIISGIRPQIAQTIVHLGVELNDVSTKATLADAFQLALQRTGQTVGRAKLTNKAN